MADQLALAEPEADEAVIPRGWRPIWLRSILREPLRNGHSAKESADGQGIRTLTLTAVTRRQFSEANTKVTVAEANRVRDLWLRSGDIFVERANTSELVGLAAIYEGPSGFAIYPDLLVRVRVDLDQADPYFVAHFLLRDSCRRYYRASAKGTAGNMPKIDHGTIENTPIWLPPLSEQHAIAGILRSVQQATGKTRQVVTAARELKQALMLHLITYGPVPFDQADRVPLRETEFGPVPEAWHSLPLSECADVQTGVAKGRNLNGAEVAIVPYLRVANVQDGFLDLTEIKTISIRRSELTRFSLQDGDVLLTEGGDFDKLGRGFIWRGEVPGCVHQNHIFAVRAQRGRLMPEFLTYLTQSAYGKAYFLSVAHKTTNLACINTTKLKAFPALIPPLGDQAKVVAALQAVDRKIEVEETRWRCHQDLFTTLLDNLMTGKVRVHDLTALRAPGGDHAPGR